MQNEPDHNRATGLSPGAWIRARRKALDLTQKQLATLVGCSADTLRKIEAERQRPSQQMASRLATILQFDGEERARFIQRARQIARPLDEAATPESASPPTAAAPNSVHHTSIATPLPVALTRLVGREADLTMLAALLRSPDVRLLTLVGPAGVGKTRLALAVGHRLAAIFRDGVCWLSLVHVNDPTLVLHLLARELGLHERQGQPILTMLVTHLRTRQMLIILDNCEQVSTVARDLATLLSYCPELTLLTTSRVVLRIRGEREYAVAPLTLPTADTVLTPAIVRDHTACHLFLDRLRDHLPGFEPPPEQLAVLVAICVRLDGLPLALELAAAQARLLPLPELLTRLQQRFALLSEGASDAPPHQQSLKATLDWSYALLTSTEQRLFRHLAVFDFGCTLEAAQQVLRGDDAELVRELTTLVEHSLLQRSHISGSERLAMLSTVQAYAAEHLHNDPEATTLRARHAAYYLAQAEQWAEAIQHSSSAAVLEQIDAEYVNVRAALNYTIAQGQLSNALTLGSVLWHLWIAYGQASVGQRWLHEALIGSTVSGPLHEVAIDAATFDQLLTDHYPAAGALPPKRLIGRSVEEARIIDWLQPLLVGRSAGVLVIAGPPGIGKSRLVETVQQQVVNHEHLNWLVCTADEIMPQSLVPLRRLLRQAIGYVAGAPGATNQSRLDDHLKLLLTNAPSQLAAELKRLHPFLAALAGIDASTTTIQPSQLPASLWFANVQRAIVTWICAHSSWQPLVLLLEDCHWFDADTLAVIAQLQAQSPHYPLGLLCTMRTSEGDPVSVQLPFLSPEPPSNVAWLSLGPLDRSAIQQFATQILSGTPSNKLLELLQTQTGGNPFFLEQLLYELNETGAVITHPNTSFGTPISDLHSVAQGAIIDMHEMLMRRLDQLSTHIRRVVQTAAVLGREVEVEVLIEMLRVSQPDGIVPDTSPLLRDATRNLRYLFRHSLLWDAAYQMQSQERLRELHALAGATIERIYAHQLDEQAAILAYHYGRAADPERERSYAQRAGVYAAHQFANRDALNHLTRALVLTAPTEYATLYAILTQRAEVYNVLGDREAQRADLQRLALLAEQIGELHWQLAVTLQQARLYELTAAYPDAMAQARRAIALAQHLGDQSSEAAAHLQWGIALYRQGDNYAAHSQAERVLVLIGNTPGGQTVTMALRLLGSILLDQGDLAQARNIFQRSLRVCQNGHDLRGEAQSLINLGNTCKQLGDYNAARDYYEQALERLAQIGDRVNETLARGNRGTLAINYGDYGQAEHDIELALTHFCAMGDRDGECWMLAHLGLVRLKQGDYQAARLLCEQAATIAAAIGSSEWHGDALLYQGHILLALGSPAAAAACYRQSVEVRCMLRHEHRALEPKAGLALALLHMGDTLAAQATATEVWICLREHNLASIDDPFQAFLACYQVLIACADPQAAEVLYRAYTLLLQRAELLTEPALQHMFLASVPAHQEIRRLQTSQHA